METQTRQLKTASPKGEAEQMSSPGRSMAPPAFSFQDQPGEAVVQKQDAGTTAPEQEEQTTPVIETTGQAWSHYMNGGGASVDIGPTSIQSLIDSEDFQFRHGRITGGLTSALSGNFSVDMTGTVFHIGRTNVEYNIECSGENCTVTYTLFVNDGFWDVDFIDENILGRLGSRRHQADGMGPNLERFGGQPYHYNTATRSFTFTNPGY